jgi:hypothetical protein
MVGLLTQTDSRQSVSSPRVGKGNSQGTQSTEARHSLLLVQLPSRIQIIEIQNRVEDQEVTA